MLRRLTVKNLAIVEDLQLELGPGLTVLTGETGAGKSILVDAVALLAGGRGSADLVRQGSERLVVAGEFESDRSVREILEEAGLPSDDVLLVRREVSSDGRGRAFIDDQPAAVRTLARIGERLVSIQGQNSERELVDADAPLELLDAFAGAGAERDAVAAAAAAWAEARDAREKLEASRRDRSARLETVAFQIGEIEAISPNDREEEDLTIERERLLHADRIRLAGETASTQMAPPSMDIDGSTKRIFSKAFRCPSVEASFNQKVTYYNHGVAMPLTTGPSNTSRARRLLDWSNWSPMNDATGGLMPPAPRSTTIAWRPDRHGHPPRPPVSCSNETGVAPPAMRVKSLS